MELKTNALLDLQCDIKRFSDILDANNIALTEIAQLQQQLQSGKPLSIPLIVQKTTNILVETYKMVKSINELSGNKYPNLFKVYEKITEDIKRKLGENTGFKLKKIINKLVIPFSEIDNSYVDAVGGKIAFLCDIKNKAGMPVPDGFAITESAYKLVLNQNELSKRINALISDVDFTDIESLYRTGTQIQQSIVSSKLPLDLDKAIQDALKLLNPDASSEFRVSVRSSAMFESSQYTSFAGQYRSLLNVSPDELNDAYLRVVASKFEPEAIIYARIHGYEITDLSMCVGIQRMINSRISGIMYTGWQKRSQIMIQAIYGLGLYIVNGALIPDTYIYDYDTGDIVLNKPGEKSVMLTCDIYGTRELKVPEQDVKKLCLDKEQIIRLGEMGKKLTRLYNMPLDIEWTIDDNSNIFILQCRPLLVDMRYPSEKEEQDFIDIEWAIDEHGEPYIVGYVELNKNKPKLKEDILPDVKSNRVIVEGGITASEGIATGNAFNVNTTLDILRFPSNAIAITKTADPKLAVLLTKMKGIVSERGDLTGHLATVAREMNIPALFGTGVINISDGTPITLDATRKKVYEGVVEGLEDKMDRDKNKTSAVLLLESLLKDIAVLNIPNPANSNTEALRCRTIHDIIRFIHQIAIEEMFKTCDNKVAKGYKVKRILTPIPMELMAFDLGGGIADNAPEGDVPLDYVVSIPMRALWRGMMYKGIKWSGERNINISGLISAMANYMVDSATSIRGLGAPSYVFITKNYMNFNSRVGYHFATIDAYAGEQKEMNYINFRFSGGANALERRSRRANLIERLLNDAGFISVRTMDIIDSHIRNIEFEAVETKLEYLGRLLGFVNRLDIAMVTDNDVERYYNAFKEQKYDVF
ncbi:MAG: PEP/pyruvate-binding domain-containing protein [bacterium]